MTIKRWLKSLLTGLLLLSLAFPQAALASSTTVDSPQEDDLEIFQEALHYLEENNIEGVQRKELIENAIRGMVYSLEDPYSEYFTKEELDKFKNQLNQQYVGIGVLLRFKSDTLYVTEVLDGSPAKKAGIRKGDIIVKVDGTPVKSSSDIYRIQGEDNTKVSITVKRGSTLLTLQVTRGAFTLPAVTSRMISNGDIGYIALSSFTDQADEEFATHLAKLRKMGMKSLVLDLRDNLGGYVETAYNIAKQMMPEGVLMYTETAKGKRDAVEVTAGSSLDVPIIILTNEQTASSSEILAAGLRDNGLATIIGTQTYGKARIQNLYSLSDGSSLKLTVLKYLTPNLEDFNDNGLTPDIEVKHNITAQLITGLLQAGLKGIEVTGSPAELKINQVAFNGYIDSIYDNGKVYASSRVLAALLQCNISWSSKSGTLTLTNQAGNTQTYTLKEGNVKLVNNESFIELDAFKKKNSRFNWSYQKDNETITLKIN